MGRKTIDFGIDLGTTNSVIACMDGGELVLIRNQVTGSEVTPVSYTHLDVYKRQSQRVPGARGCRRCGTQTDLQAAATPPGCIRTR